MNLSFYQQLAHALSCQFGENCEIVLYKRASDDADYSAVLVENAHVTGCAVGDAPSGLELETMTQYPVMPEDHLAYLTKTNDGRIIKSSMIYIPDETQTAVAAILSIHYDITGLLMAQHAVQSLVADPEASKVPAHMPTNVNELLDDLIRQSVTLIGKPVALMTKDDKVRAIQYLNDAGAFLITKSGDKISNYFGISKYTLYSYIDVNK